MTIKPAEDVNTTLEQRHFRTSFFRQGKSLMKK